MTDSDATWHSFESDDHAEIHYQRWAADNAPRAAVQIMHGAAEHGGRYTAFANVLLAQGYAVYAADHRGHGRTRIGSGELGDAGPDGWQHFVDDERRLTRIIQEAHPQVPVVLFGHSLGSFIAQDYIARDSAAIDALILSGTAYDPGAPESLLVQLDTEAEATPQGPSAFWRRLFAEFNRPFSDQPGFQWLSRDPEAIADYERDPLTGFTLSNALVRDYLRGMSELRVSGREASIRSDLPILVIQGEHDPVGGNLKKTRALLDHYAQLGLTQVDHIFYSSGRHEMLNETNREAVYDDILTWLTRHLA